MNPIGIDGVENFITICTAITVLVSVINIFISIVNKAQEPDRKQDARISELEERVSKAEMELLENKEILEKYEMGNRVTQESLLALMEHALDGNSIEQLKRAKNNLYQYLIKK